MLQQDPETAEKLFQKTLDSQPEAQVKAWALVIWGGFPWPRETANRQSNISKTL